MAPCTPPVAKLEASALTKCRLINNSRESYRFAFDGLLPPDAQQQEVFERVALPVLRSALDGYNGTVFAFGQTGSGKTFTITGGAERYADRGLIPRALSALFLEAAKRSDHTFAVHVSYMGTGCLGVLPAVKGGKCTLKPLTGAPVVQHTTGHGSCGRCTAHQASARLPPHRPACPCLRDL